MSYYNMVMRSLRNNAAYDDSMFGTGMDNAPHLYVATLIRMLKSKSKKNNKKIGEYSDNIVRYYINNNEKLPAQLIKNKNIKRISDIIYDINYARSNNTPTAFTVKKKAPTEKSTTKKSTVGKKTPTQKKASTQKKGVEIPKNVTPRQLNAIQLIINQHYDDIKSSLSHIHEQLALVLDDHVAIKSMLQQLVANIVTAAIVENIEANSDTNEYDDKEIDEIFNKL